MNQTPDPQQFRDRWRECFGGEFGLPENSGRERYVVRMMNREIENHSKDAAEVQKEIERLQEHLENLTVSYHRAQYILGNTQTIDPQYISRKNHD